MNKEDLNKIKHLANLNEQDEPYENKEVKFPFSFTALVDFDSFDLGEGYIQREDGTFFARNFGEPTFKKGEQYYLKEKIENVGRYMHKGWLNSYISFYPETLKILVEKKYIKTNE